MMMRNFLVDDDEEGRREGRTSNIFRDFEDADELEERVFEGAFAESDEANEEEEDAKGVEDEPSVCIDRRVARARGGGRVRGEGEGGEGRD
jgi:hypothetical protein